ncbi:MAG: hypothetical protein KTR20_15720 [Cellvibrionaceae bacterium]|nr:hypothetical protein [Cellvibrionaceae bacterium]
MDHIAMRRTNETGNIPVRSDRFFTQQNYWYFRTREGMDIGPFSTHAEAIEGVNGFVDFLTEAEPDVVTRISEYVTQAA